jgi:PAS domain S-box-containing protein
MQTWLVLWISILYLAALFAIAWWGDRLPNDRPLFARGSFSSAAVYTLMLAIHVTAWSFYGGAGRAAAKGFDYLATSIGAFIFLIIGQGVLRRIISLSKARNITSISDFLSARYGGRRPIAAFVAIASLVGLLPYMALQIKAIGFSFDILTGSASTVPAAAGLIGATDFRAALVLAAFTALFGVRHIHASERHRGFVLALAFESFVKLVAYVGVALFVLYEMYDGIGDVLARAHDDATLEHLLVWDWRAPEWYAKVTVGFLAFLCMPQMFHVAVIENDDAAAVRWAGLLYPAYVLVFAAFMTPIALAGLVAFGDSIGPDKFMITLPMAAGSPTLGLLAFIGGLSSAAGMIMVSSVALATMLCNDVVLPFLLGRQARRTADTTKLLLFVRRALVFAVILAAFVMRRFVDDSASLVQMGVTSMVAAAQLAPAFFIGGYWRKASASGALAGMSLGFAIWLYTLLLPSMAEVFGVSPEFLDAGPWGIGWLRPQSLFGSGLLDPLLNAVVWSLVFNVGAFVLVSLALPTTLAEAEAASSFAHASPRPERADATRELAAIAARFVGSEHADAAFRRYFETPMQTTSFDFAIPADDNMVRFAENLIAGAIGTASARIVLAGALHGRRLSRADARAMIEDASAALHHKHALLRAITENVQQGICAVDVDLRLLAWNHRFAEMLDLPDDFLKVGLPLATIVAFNKARGEYTAEQYELLFANRDAPIATWPFVYERARPDGTVLEVTFNRMDVGGYVATYADVTEHHRAAQALRDANEQLEHRIRERTLALELAKRAAEEANAGKTRFLAAASHDLLQPLTAARLFLSAQQASLEGREGTEMDLRNVAAFTENALAALQSTEALLSELLYMSSLDSRAIQPVVQDVAIGAMLAQLGAEFSALAGTRGLALRVVPTSAMARADPILLRRVVQNLLSNAIRYTAVGRVLVGCRRCDSAIRIEVWDTGVGIPEDMQQNIFNEFWRLPQEAEVEKGMGLGLAIVDRIARLLDARVILRSKVGVGSMFAIEVPRASSPPYAPTRDSSPLPMIGTVRDLLVLCLDNDEPVRDGMKALLEQWGCRVVCAHDLETAIQFLGEVVPDVALVDYHLDKTRNGLDVLDELRRRWNHDAYAVLVTADRSDHVRRAAHAARCEVLHKPVKPAALRRYLTSATLRRATSRSEE